MLLSGSHPVMSSNYTWKGLESAYSIVANLSNAITDISKDMPTMNVDYNASIAQMLNNITSFNFLSSTVPSPNPFGTPVVSSIFSSSATSEMHLSLSSEVITLQSFISDLNILSNIGSKINVS